MFKIMMLVALVSWVGAAQDTVEKKSPDQELASICEKAAKADSFTFKIETKDEGGGGGRRGGRGGFGAAASGPIVGKYQKTAPLAFKRGDVELFRMGDQTVYQTADGEWKTLDARGGFGGFGRGGGQGGGRRGEGGGGRGERGDFDRSAMTAFRTARQVVVPTDLLANITSKVTDLKAGKKSGMRVFVGNLTAAAAGEFGGGARMGRMAGGGGRGGAAPESSGTIEVFVSAKGMIKKIELNTTTNFSFGERSFERKRQTIIELSNYGKTTVNIPPDALSKLKSGSESGV